MFTIKGIFQFFRIILHSVFRVWTIQVSNLFRSPHFSEFNVSFIIKWCYHSVILTSIIRLYPYSSYSPFFLQNSSILSYHTSCLLKINYAAHLVLPRLLAQDICQDHSFFTSFWYKINLFQILRQLGQTFVHCPIFLTAALGRFSSWYT